MKEAYESSLRSVRSQAGCSGCAPTAFFSHAQPGWPETFPDSPIPARLSKDLLNHLEHIVYFRLIP